MFEPINRAHSILEASFNLGFVSSLEKSRREELIRGIRDNQELQAFLPKVEELKVRAIQFQAEDVSPSYEDDFGFELKRFKEDGNPEWTLAVLPSGLSLRCLDYQRWKGFIRIVSVLLEEIFQDSTHGPSPLVESLSLRYIDAFIKRNKEGEDYQLSTLFRDNNYVNRKSFDSGYRWHSNSGWFEKISYDGRPLEYLNQLNVSSGTMNIRNLENTTILIDHNMLLTNMCEWLDYETVSRFLDDMHDNNKKLLSLMLVTEVSKKLMLVDLN